MRRKSILRTRSTIPTSAAVSQPSRSTRMLAGLWLVAAFSQVLVLGELCQFPTDNPIQDMTSGQTIQVQVVGNNRAYIYNQIFDDCHGCVRALHFCYRFGGSGTSELMTIEIRDSGNSGVQTTHTVMVDPNIGISNCAERFTLSELKYCCVEQNLTVAFEVDNQNNHYALKIPNTGHLLLYDTNQPVDGEQEDHNGNPIQQPVHQPLFYFTIDKSDSDCSNTPPTTPSDNTPSEGTTEIPTTDGTSTTTATPTRSPTTDSNTPFSPEVETAAQRGDSSSVTGPVAAVIAVLLTILALLAIVVVVTVVCIKKKRQGKVMVTRMEEKKGGIMNVVYGETPE